ncbi:Tat pathway signal sequence domain protein, partial [Streptomyces pharetrae CZA14]
MTPNAASASSGPSRRSFLASTAVATAAVAGGMPLLAACGGSDDGDSREGTTSGRKAQKLLPAYVASNVVAPDIPAKNGSALGFTRGVDLAALKTSVPKKLGKGGSIKIMSPFWGTPPKGDNPYYRTMNDLIG